VITTLCDSAIGRLGWTGRSDYDAWANILKTHHYVADMEDAAAEGINAGLDQEGGGWLQRFDFAVWCSLDSSHLRSHGMPLANS
jgi:hypothetical protein